MEPDKEVELSVRRVVSDELRRRGGQHGGGVFSGLGAFGLALMFCAFVLAFAFLHAQSLSAAEERLAASLDSRLLEFRIADSLRARVQAYVGDSLDDILASDQTQASLRAMVEDQANAAVNDAGAVIQSRVSSQVRLSLSSLPNGSDLIGSLQVPSGAVMAFDRQRCPEGWSGYEPLAGRVVVGAGRGDGLTQRRVGDRGGDERVSLSLSQMPQHRHANPTAGGNQVVQEVNGLSVTGRGSYGPQHARPTDTAGQSQPHENMPPFLALLYCRKN